MPTLSASGDEVEDEFVLNTTNLRPLSKRPRNTAPSRTSGASTSAAASASASASILRAREYRIPCTTAPRTSGASAAGSALILRGREYRIPHTTAPSRTSSASASATSAASVSVSPSVTASILRAREYRIYRTTAPSRTSAASAAASASASASASILRAREYRISRAPEFRRYEVYQDLSDSSSFDSLSSEEESKYKIELINIQDSEEESEQEEDEEIELINIQSETREIADEAEADAIDSGRISLTDPDVLNCPICFETLCSPVFQCENGHISCDSCCTKMKNKCGSCSFPIGYNRCRAIEKVLESARVSCPNMQHGCTEKILYTDKVNHEKTCKYAPCSCPHSDCTFIGMYRCLYSHFATQHPNSSRKFIFNSRVFISLDKEHKHAILLERVTKMLFIVNRRNETLGSCLSVICLAPTSSKRRSLYELTVKYADSSINLKSVAECMPKLKPRLPIKKFLIVPSDFGHSSGHLKLDLIIRRPTRDS